MKVSSQIEWTIGNVDIHVVLTLSGLPDSDSYKELYEVVVIARDETVEFSGLFSAPQTEESLVQWLETEIKSRLQFEFPNSSGRRIYIN